MKKLAFLAAAALAIPVASATAADTPSPSSAASTACKALRSSMPGDTFKTTYGTNKNRSNAMGKCVSKQTKAEEANQANAAKQCKAERDDVNFAAAHGGKTFAEFYGTNKDGKNAYGKCVSGKAKAASKDDVEAITNAAKTCKKAKKDDAAAFAQAYGTKRNAFGKCVSKAAKAQNDEASA
jgi:hypothetical protein